MSGRLQHYVTRQAERKPNAVAVVMGGESRLSYRTLDHESDKLARLLIEAGCRRGDRVCLFLRKSPAAVVALVATLKAGCAYVPVDVTSPAPRLEKVLRTAAPRLILADERSRELLDEVLHLARPSQETKPERVREFIVGGGPSASRLEALDWPDAGGEGEPFSESSSGEVAHILFTSGSTGMPKGVVVTHASVAHFIEWATRYFGITSSDRISCQPPFHFDLSTFDIFGTFRAGAELHLVPPELNVLPHRLADFIRESELTQWFSVPSQLALMETFDVVAHDDFPSLKRVLWCGEVLPTRVLRYWMERLPHAVFTNLYGPTETTIASSFHTVTERPSTDTDPIPIGRACSGEEFLLLDDELEPVARGEVGELYIAGVGLTPGYWRDDDATRSALVPDPRSPDPSARIYKTGDLARQGEDGLYYFLGRRDSQIKHRGYRIELGEIESAVGALRLVRECAIVAIDTEEFGGTVLCCAYVPAPGTRMSSGELRARLREVLPRYMVPARWLELAELPKNGNGKIDRSGLRLTFQATEASGARAVIRS